MNYFLKLLGKEEIKYFKRQKQCSNPPRKSLIKPKSLLIKNPKKTKKRKFGKELQNLPILTDQNNLSFNQRKRNRNKNDIILIGKRNNKCNDITFCTKKIFNISNNNITPKTEFNISENTKKNEDKENIQNLHNQSSQNNIKIEVNNNININSERTNLIKINIAKIHKLNNIVCNRNIKKNNIEKNSENNADNKDINLIKDIHESKNELNVIKVKVLTGVEICEKNKKIRHNLQRAKEYLEEIHFYLKSIESKGIALSNYMLLIQTDINEKMRIILINWLIEVHFKFHLLNETLFICINIIDRYLSQKNINRKYLQLLGITSLFIASKYEEIYAPSAKDLIFMTDNAYKIEEMIKMENEILGVLKFELTFPTSLRFLELYGNSLNLDEINLFRCYYLNEVSLICYNLCGFCPSLIACACLYINLKSNLMFFKGYNEEELFKISGYKKAEINSCLNLLINALIKMEDPNNKFISIKKKYALDKYKNVSNEHYLIETD